jgi:uncharacterized protein
MRNYALPSYEECLSMIRDCHVPVHIVRHAEAATRLAVFLAHRLVERGIELDIELVERACLLHDLFRVCDFPLEEFTCFEQPVTEHDKHRWRKLKARHGHLRHEDAADTFLKDKYPVLATAIRRHRYVAVLDEADCPQSWEEKLVYYADKRAMHDTIVPLKQRLEDAHQRSALAMAKAGKTRNVAMEQAVDARIFELEAEIFDVIGLNPDDVTEELIARDSIDLQRRTG